MENLLGDYLRARRELVAPEDVGLPAGGRRRVRGLRREELALLAGISSDYYMRLEQGRDQNPSAQVLDALARVLGLDAAAATHLHSLAAPPPAVAVGAPPVVPPSIAELIGTWPTTPAYVQDRLTNVLAANAIATAFSPKYAPGHNLLREVFLDPAERDFRVEWEQITADGVGGLRASLGANVGDPAATELVTELAAKSERFRELWARHDIKPRTAHRANFRHPVAGPIGLHSDKLTLPGADALQLVVFHATPGTRDAEALASLTNLVRTE
ncbi:helix-turn-helix domain-containing protein [Amycolatopsis sp. FDAARGOS 1241]|uniref:helix-turn-helix domain-containing protein n=1 Tax=Amycolatopsis sp. FDAARGOS 1241 TaxID=2778070 RepID=UPI001950848D|nr:helix-turn-helix transcriptional regulator [Amycolatopsis sp. FDAARGOS 1241]QRP49867.1 helix-turn-helix domain-containing protein [Amycolatopsis sp. FDAARGOS 1241]